MIVDLSNYRLCRDMIKQDDQALPILEILDNLDKIDTMETKIGRAHV